MKKLRWGVLSTAKIARTKVIPAIQTSLTGEVVAIASRDLSKTRDITTPLGIKRAYGSYEELLADPNIDAIYNPLPNHMHVPYSIAALEAGKHVLCEKPLGLDTADAQKLLDAANAHPNLVTMEAFMYRFHPQWQLVKRWIDEGAIGKVRHIHSHFAYNNQDKSNIRNIPEWGGGALMDIGCYCISLSRFLLNAEPQRVMGQITPYEGFDVDCFVSGMLDFGSALSSFTAATKSEPEQYVDIHGEHGQIRLLIPFNPPSDSITQVHLKRDGKLAVHTQLPCDHYRIMTDAFADAVLNDKPVPTPLDDAIANMKIIDAIFASAKNSQWISLSSL